MAPRKGLSPGPLGRIPDSARIAKWRMTAFVERCEESTEGKAFSSKGTSSVELTSCMLPGGRGLSSQVKDT